MKRILASTLFVLGIAAFGLGQNTQTQNTKNTADQTLRSAGRVNPSTLGMEFDLPLGSYASRGFSLPLGLSYSSKLWRFQDAGTIQGDQAHTTRVYTFGVYSDNAASGWSSSLSQPYIEYTGEFNRFDNLGRPLPGGDSVGVGAVGDNYVRRITVFLPDGSSHEMRAADGAIVTPTPGPYPPSSAWEGTFYASDGSGLKYVQTSSSSLYRLYLPDGSFWDFNSTKEDHMWTTQIRRGIKLTDVNGNYVQFDTPDTTYPNGSWTDQLGRVFPVMIPRDAPQITSGEVLSQSFTLPGMGYSYTLKWKHLKGSTADVSAFTDFSNQSLHYVGGTPENSTATNTYTPALFTSGNTMGQGCVGDNSVLYVSNLPNNSQVTVFNPVVLSEIVLPTGASYKFTYNEFGEMEHIIYPTGGHEEFTYGAVASLSNMDPTYQQTNRGVTVSKVFENDGDTAPAISQYFAAKSDNNFRTSIIAPDGTQTDNFMHRGIPMATCSQVDYPTFINTFGTRWGYDNILAGKTYETRVFSSGASPHILQQTFTKWDATTTTLTIRNSGPEYLKRNVHVQSTQTITYDGDSGLNAITKFEYDTDKDDVGSPLNVTAKREYSFQVVPSGGNSYLPAGSTDLPPSGVITIADPTTGLTPVRSTETIYKTDSTYKNQNLLRLPTQISITDASGTKAKSQITYDESTYLVSDSTTGTVPGWTNLASSVRGLPTTTNTLYDIFYNLSIATHTQYNQFGSPRKSWDGKGNVSEVQYDDRFSDSTDRHTYAFATKTISPIPGGNGSTSAFQTQTTYKFPEGLALSSLDINGQTTAMEYNDALLRPTKVTAPNGQQTITEYGAGTDSSTRYVKIKSQTDAYNWKQAYTWFDGLGRRTLTQEVDTNGDVYVHTEYDSAGRVSKVSNPYRNISSPSCTTNLECTTNTYDSAGRTWKVTTPDSAVVQTTYSIATSGNSIGTTVTVTDQAGKLRRSVTDAMGHLIRVDEPDASNQLGAVSTPNQDTRYTYDLLNNLLTVVQGSQTRTLTYDAMSRLKSAANPESGTVSYGYDSNGNLTSKTDARLIITSYTYDTLNRVQTRSYNDGTTPAATYYYDTVTNANGKLIKVTNANSTTEYTSFDILGRVTGHKQTTDGTAYTTGYTYDLAGNLLEETYPSTRVVKNVLDSNGDLAEVESKKNSAAGYWSYANSFTYTSAGAVSSMQLGNGRWESTHFNSRLQPDEIYLGTTPGGSDKLKLDYTYNTTGNHDNNGNVLTQTITVSGTGGFTAVQSYGYDSLNRLLSADEKPSGWIQSQCTSSPTSCWKQTFTYDRYGNRRFDEANTTMPSSFVNPAVTDPTISASTNRITSTGYNYDNTGNVTYDAALRKYTYDAENKQTKAESTNSSQVVTGTLGEYTYDGDGRRVKKYVPGTGETTIFVYDAGGKQVAEYSTIVADGSSAKVDYITTDQLGSPRINTDANGTITCRHDYHPFGEEIIGAGGRTTASGYAIDTVRKQFTAYERDGEDNLDFAQARYYNSQHGRFMSVDPIMASAEIINPQTFNRYVYVGNNPVNITDPTGELWGQLNGNLQWFKNQAALEDAGFSNYNALVGSVNGGLVVLSATSGTYTAVASAEEALRTIAAGGATGVAIEASAVALGYVAVGAGTGYLFYKAFEYNATHPGQQRAYGCPAIADCAVQGEKEILDKMQKNPSTEQEQSSPANPNPDPDNNKPNASVNKSTPQEIAKKRGGELVNQNADAGQGVGRSGGGGTRYIKAGNQLIQEANRLPKNDPLRAAMKTEGTRLLNKGRSINHK